MENNRQATPDLSHQSRWLQSTLAELERKIKRIVEVVEDDGERFGDEMSYYNKRPQLIQAVQDLQRCYISLANKDKHLSSEFLCGGGSSSMSNGPAPPQGRTRISPLELVITDEGSDSHERRSCSNNNAISKLIGTGGAASDSRRDTISSSERDKMWNKMRLSVSELIEEGISQQAELIRRNNEKRESIKQLRLYINQLQMENRRLRHSLAAPPPPPALRNIDHSVNQNRSHPHISKFKGLVFWKMS